MSEMLRERIDEVQEFQNETMGTDDFPYWFGYGTGLEGKFGKADVPGTFVRDNRVNSIRDYNLGWEDGHGERERLLANE